MKKNLSLISFLLISGVLFAAPGPTNRVGRATNSMPASVRAQKSDAVPAHKLRQDFMRKWPVLTEQERKDIQAILDRHK